MSGLIGVDATVWANRRGYGRFARGLLPPLAERVGPDRLVLFLDPLSAEAGDLPAGVRRVVVPLDQAPTRAASAQGRRSVADLLRMGRAAAAAPLDLFFFPTAYTYFPILRPSRTVLTIHDVIAERHPELVFPRRRLAWFWRTKMLLARLQADLVLTVSEASRRAIVRQFHLAPDKVRVVPEGAEATFHPRPDGRASAAALARYGLTPAERFVLYVGGISPHKNLDMLMRSFGALVNHPCFADVRLVLVGDYSGDSFHSCYADLIRLRTALGLERHVSFTGYVPDADLAELYSAALALIMPSFEEGFGLPVLEAMASGTAVVASGRGSLPEVLGGAGRLFDPASDADLTLALDEVLGDERRRGDMIRRGLERARAYTWARSAEAVARAFEDLLKGRRTDWPHRAQQRGKA
ncbi:MAG: glycosyltransferase family 4 protein [Chloroflexota bacterium]|nr:glycosyltransferase family 4 protein [Chloroflexota bacterium]